MKLTPKQTELIQRGIINGQLNHNDFVELYATSISRRETINRFLVLNIVTDAGTRFIINKEVAIKYIQPQQNKVVENQVVVL